MYIEYEWRGISGNGAHTVRNKSLVCKYEGMSCDTYLVFI